MEKEMERRLKTLANVLHDAAKEAEKCSEYPQQLNEIQRSLRSLRFENESLHYSLEKMKTEQRNKEKEFAAELNKEHASNTSLKARLKESLQQQDKLRMKLQDTLENKTKVNEVSDKLRPTKVAETYQELYDNQWTDAYEELEKYFLQEERTTQELLRILKNTMEFCQNMIEQQNDQLQSCLLFTDKKADGMTSQTIQRQLITCRKDLASETIENLFEMYLKKLRQSKDLSCKRELEIKPFVKECIGVCWMCLIQFPSLKVDFEPSAHGKYFDTDTYRPYTKSGTKIDYIVWPALLLSENGPVIAKGIAQGLTLTRYQNQNQKAIKEKHGGKTPGIFVSVLDRYKQMSKSENDLSTKHCYPNYKSSKEVNKFQGLEQRLSPRRKAGGNENLRNVEAARVQPVPNPNYSLNKPNSASVTANEQRGEDGDSKQHHTVNQERLSRARQIFKYTSPQQQKEERSSSRTKGAGSRHLSTESERRRSVTPTHSFWPQRRYRSPSPI